MTPQPKKSGDVVGLLLQNPTTSTLPSREVTFGQIFVAGQLPAASGLVATVNGTQLPIQVDVKTTYPDGSARMTIVTMQAPALPAVSSTSVMLSLGAKEKGRPVDLTTLGAAGYDVKVKLTFHNKDGSTTGHTVHAGSALQQALSGGTAAYWMQGPQATEARVDVPIVAALHVIFDVRGYVDGSTFTDVQINNDIAMSSSGGEQDYDVSIQYGGTTIDNYAGIHQYEYSSWHQGIWSNGTPPVNVQHDVAYLERASAIPPYDLTTGVASATLDSELQQMGSGWNAPLATNGVSTYMGATGGRPDIGPQPQWIAVWLLTQDAGAAAYALGNADAGGSIPWNMWDAARGRWLNTNDIPDIWTDPRGGPGTYTTGLTQPPPLQSGSQPWVIDTAHQPDLNYVPYILTGQHYRLDRLEAQAAYSITDAWPTARNVYGAVPSNDIVSYGLQIRATAWDLREIQEAAWISDDGSFAQAYFNQVMDDNLTYFVGLEPSLTKQTGELAGIWGMGDYTPGVIPPWQLDFLASALGVSASQGNTKAAQVLGWMDGYLAGRFLPQAGWDQHDGCTYNIVAGTPSNVYMKTWAAVEGATAAQGYSNGKGWTWSQGYFCQLGIETLSYLVSIVHSAQDADALAWLKAAGAPYTDKASNQTDPTCNITLRP